MFCGNYLMVLDGRNRVTIPARFAGSFCGAQIHLSSDKCLVVFPVANSDKNPRTMDSRRVTIPDRLIEKAGLKNKVVVVGCGDYVEVWDNFAWEREIAQKEEP